MLYIQEKYSFDIIAGYLSDMHLASKSFKWNENDVPDFMTTWNWNVSLPPGNGILILENEDCLVARYWSEYARNFCRAYSVKNLAYSLNDRET